MFDATDQSLLWRQLSRFKWLIWCYLPSVVLIWALLLAAAALPEHWFPAEKGVRFTSLELLTFATVLLAALSTLLVNGIIVFKTLGERFGLRSLSNALITTAVFLFVFPAVDKLLGSPFKHLVPWLRSGMDGAMASSQTTLDMLINVGLLASVQLLSLTVMFAAFPMVLVLMLALFKHPHRQPPETLP